jgi:hypothetical protein
MTRKLPIVLLIVALGATALAATNKAAALKRVEDMSRIALEEIDLGDFPAAEMRLGEAIAVARSAGLDRHASTARAHLYLAAALAGQNDKAGAVKSIRAALSIDPRVPVPDKLKTPAMTSALAEAKGLADPSMEAAPQGGIQHVPVDNVTAGKAIAVEAQVGADVKAKKVMLFFKPETAKTFKAVPMKNVTGTAWRADIPADATAGTNVAYYIDARNAKAKVVATRGTASKPYVVSVVKPVKVEDVKAVDKNLDDEDPLKATKK